MHRRSRLRELFAGVLQHHTASGAFSFDDPLDPAPAPGIVPDAFTMCVTDEGSAAVVPGRIECSALALFPVSGEHPD